jgi:alkanesulfonate monooxygenase SsuD/methylene tetrahydromethanopterin reductase-like flavin-dependent oxidoreductase (luciferase family)
MLTREEYEQLWLVTPPEFLTDEEILAILHYWAGAFGGNGLGYDGPQYQRLGELATSPPEGVVWQGLGVEQAGKDVDIWHSVPADLWTLRSTAGMFRAMAANGEANPDYARHMRRVAQFFQHRAGFELEWVEELG